MGEIPGDQIQIRFGKELGDLKPDALRPMVRAVVEEDEKIQPGGHEAEVERVTGRLAGALGNNRLAVATVLDEVASTAFLKYWGRWRGKPLYELKAVLTDPKFQRNHLASRVQGRCIQEVLSTDPDSVIIVITESPKLSNMYDGLVDEGTWRRMSLEECRETLIEGDEAMFSPEFLKHQTDEVHIYCRE